jgi:CcmD family protein
VKRLSSHVLLGWLSLAALTPVLGPPVETPLAAAAQPPASQDEFVPIDELPPSESLPAARFLIAAYAFAWLAVLFYVATVWKRLARVEADLRRLEARRVSRDGTS